MSPIRGIYLEYYAGIGKDVTAGLPQAAFDELEGAEKYERIYIKEAIGEFLGLTLAPPRVGVFNSSSTATNRGRNFSYRKQKGSKTFKIGLQPGTIIPQRYGQRDASGRLDIVTDTTRTVGEFQISLPRTCSVSEVIEWMMKGTIVLPDGNVRHTLSDDSGGSADAANNGFSKIIYIITPADRKHPIRGMFEGSEIPLPTEEVNEPGEKPATSGSSDSGTP